MQQTELNSEILTDLTSKQVVTSRFSVSQHVKIVILKSLCFLSCSHLDYNSLAEVNSGSLYGLTSLQQLFLSNNSIARINPDGWKFCQKLREL